MLGPAISELKQFLSTQSSSNQWPELLSMEQQDSAVDMRLAIPHELTYFEGHFPTQPVLPGVVQIHWAGEFAKRVFGLSGFQTLQGAKFNGMVLPGTKLQLGLQFKPEKNSVRFSFYQGDAKFSVGSLVFKHCNSREQSL